MRSEIVLACSLLVGACQPETSPPPPPIGGGPTGGSTVPPLGGTGGTMASSATAATGDSTDATSETDGSSGTGQALPLLSGQLLEGTAGIIPPACGIRLHTLDSLDPDTGLPTTVAYEAITAVDDLPQPYAITSVPDDSIGPGDEVYVSVLCDVDADGTPDDVGAFYPQIPLERVLLPASGIDMALEYVF